VLAIATYATKSYFYAWRQVLRAISAAAAHHEDVLFILATDTSREAKDALEIAKYELPDGWKISSLNVNVDDSVGEKYKEQSQILIATLQGAAFSLARKARAEMLWSVESDVIVSADSLRVAEWVLKMPQADGSPYYDIAAVTYPNGLFLGGFGSPQRPIAEDFLPSERKLPPRLKLCLDACEARLKNLSEMHHRNQNASQTLKSGADCLVASIEKEQKRLSRLHERIKKCPPDGNIWEVTAKHGWRRRGWMDFAYPGIGRGAIVPSDWCGLGCTLMSGKALSLATFEGYDGKGTQDLFLCWHRWHPAGLRIAAVPHTAADHVKPKPKDAPTDAPPLLHYRAYYETEGEYRGHLRVRQQPWVPC
jgi:hypothetical protein